jgi:glc operon protein GlcG
MKIINSVFAALLLLASPRMLLAQLQEKKVLTLQAAEKVAAAAEAEARKRNATVVIVVVDDGGYPIVLKRLDDTQVASVDVGIGKARTAAIFRRPSKDFEDQIKNGRVASLVPPGATPLQGGIPLVAGGKVVGAVGVSGNTPQEDEDIAKAGAASFEAGDKQTPPPVTYLPGKQVSQAFVKGAPLVRNVNYKVDASHRDEPGVVEIHVRDTDIIYMLEGTATLVTGGTTIGAKTIEPEEIRAHESRGGDSRVITKGDVVVVPNGTPHWFKEVKGPITYYVVKVRSVD